MSTPVKRSRICVVTESFYPAAHGAPWSDGPTNKQVVDRLLDLGHEVRIIAPGPGLSTYKNAPVARIRPLDKPGRQVRAALEGFRPDLVHVASPGIVGRRALKHAGQLGLRTLVVQQSPVDALGAERWMRKVHARADQVVVTCTWMQERLGALGVDAPVWRPGVDVDAWNPNLRDGFLHASWSRKQKEGTARVVVGYVGSLHKRHGVRRLVEVAAVPGVRLVVIGDGPQRGWLEEHARGAKFVGAVEPGDLTTAMATLDVLVHPGEQQTCAHALREASASGVPVVAPRSAGAIDAVRNLETGLLHDPSGPHALRAAITSIVADPQRALLGAQGRRLALQRGWVEAVDELVTDHYGLDLPAGTGAARTDLRPTVQAVT